MNVLIVESAAKGRTLQKYLGQGWRVVATGGHVETLPDDRTKHGKDAKKAFWANRANELPTPPWVWTDRGEKAVKNIIEVGGDKASFWIATDPDREGEFIAWCLDRLLAPHGKTQRVTFNEVTKEAVKAAIEQPRPVDQRMVDSALVRKFLDRLVGFRTSKTASAVVGTGASMGRVQTPTLGFVVERELERDAFVPTPYFEVRADAEGVELKAHFHDKGDPDQWRDNAGDTKLTRTFDGALAQGAFEALSTARKVTLNSIKSRTSSRRPQPPFTTDALLQDAGSRLGWSPKKTSKLASNLYEAGHITYIRTDSTRLAKSAVEAARDVVKAQFGESHLGQAAKGTVAEGPIQDAHEAIRPSRLDIADVDTGGDKDASRLYRLIRARTLASQMAPSTSASRSIEATCEGFRRHLVGSISWRTFLGWEAAYREFEAERPTAPPDIPLVEGAIWALDPAEEGQENPVLVEDETRPPARFRAHTLIKAMKEAGIGRPSTYARTVEKLEERGYALTEEGAIAPTERGRAVWVQAAPLYAASDDVGDAAELFSAAFTAEMERGLDQVATGETPAPDRWVSWRDEIRGLHEAAKERRNAGGCTMRQQQRLEALLANAPEHLVGDTGETDISAMSYEEARSRIAALREAGVIPVPSQAQLNLIERLLGDLALADDERDQVLGAGGVEALGTSAEASRVIDELQRLRDERMPPSAKQRRFIEGLIKETGVSEADAATLVGIGSLEELTGGREGTASALIEALKAKKSSGAERSAAGK